ncbi:plasmalemma vesicle associated protein b [Brachionichthys hirsutus]|uniref:plasmalemma vesicle associated protein b n=1 Tax=Brachionichthys hirsutus TaxID=412623 RepID=UPI0036046044
MHSSSYSHAKFRQEAREPLHQSRGKSCGYYMRIVFFFSSLIQSLIIVSLVLFLIYGQPEKSAEAKRVKELEINFNRLSETNVQLRKEKANLDAQLGARTAERDGLRKDVEKLKTDANITEHLLKGKLETCEKKSAMMLSMAARRPTTMIQPALSFAASSELRTLQSLNAQQKAMISFIQANFTQTVLYLSHERDAALKDRDRQFQEAIGQRRENTVLTEQLASYSRKCKEDFSQSLDGIKTVTRDFLSRINNLLPNQMTFHLTCDSQREQMEKMRNSCTNLSREVENKFQLYLDKVGDKVSEIQALSSRLEVENAHLKADFQQCERNRNEATADAAKKLQLKQRTHDIQVEQLLLEQNRLREQRKLQEVSLALKDKELQMLQRLINTQPKPGAPRASALQGSPQQAGQPGAQRPVVGPPVLSKTPTVNR